MSRACELYKGRAFVVDDDELVLMQVTAILNTMGITTITCSRSNIAFTQILEKRPLFVLLDIQMAEPNGLQLLGRLKSDFRTSSIPVGMMTAHREAAKPVAMASVRIGSIDERC